MLAVNWQQRQKIRDHGNRKILQKKNKLLNKKEKDKIHNPLQRKLMLKKSKSFGRYQIAIYFCNRFSREEHKRVRLRANMKQRGEAIIEKNFKKYLEGKRKSFYLCTRNSKKFGCIKQKERSLKILIQCNKKGKSKVNSDENRESHLRTQKV